METLNEGISTLLADSKYSDLKIKCRDKVFHVHRAIVCSRSKILRNQCDGPFQEAARQAINHNVFDPLTLDRMLQYMYRGNCTITEQFQASVTEAIVVRLPTVTTISGDSQGGNVRNSSDDAPLASSRYQSKLEKKVNGELETACQDSLSTATDTEDFDLSEPLIAHVYVWAIADYYQMPDLQDLALRKFIKEKEDREEVDHQVLINVAAVTYANTPEEADGIRNEFLEMVYLHRGASVDCPYFMQAIAERDDLKEFSADLMGELVSRHLAETTTAEEAHQAVLATYKADLDRAYTEIKSMRAALATAKADTTAALAAASSSNKALKLVESKAAKIKKELDNADCSIDRLTGFADIEACEACGQPFRYMLLPHGDGNWKAKCCACGKLHF